MYDRLIHWAIIGGESGVNARPMNPKWAYQIIKACKSCGIKVFFKQWGEWQPFNDGVLGLPRHVFTDGTVVYKNRKNAHVIPIVRGRTYTEYPTA